MSYHKTDYILSFESILENQDAMKCFTDYLSLTHNKECYEFLKLVEQYKKAELKTTLAQEIIQRFIVTEAELEININSAIRREILTTNNYPESLFDKAKSNVLVYLKEGVYVNFINSQHWKEFTSQQPKAKSLDHATCTKANIISLKEQIFKHLPTEWDIISKHDNLICYCSKQSDMIKAEIIIPFPARECMEVITNSKTKTDKNLTKTETLDYMIPNEVGHLYSVLTRYTYKLLWPLTDREFILSTSGIYDIPSRTYIICMKTVTNHPMIPPEHKDLIRCSAFGCYAFQELDTQTTKHTQLFYYDLKATIPKVAFKKLLNKRITHFRKSAIESIKAQRRESLNAYSISDNYISKTINDNFHLWEDN